MRRLFPYFFILLFSFLVSQAWAQKASKKKAKAAQSTLSNTNQSGDGKEQVNPEKEKDKSLHRLQETSQSEKAVRLATEPSTQNADHLKKIRASATEDAAGNLVQPIIIIPTALKDKDQKDAFLMLKKLAEAENTVSTFIKNPAGENLAYVIATKESLEKWLAEKPEFLLAYVFQGNEALENSTLIPIVRLRDKQGIHKLVEMQLKKRMSPSVMPTQLKLKEDVLETPAQ